MNKIADAIADAILATEADRLDAIMAEVTRNITLDFADVAHSLIDDYYFDYLPMRYVRTHGRKKFLRDKATGKGVKVSASGKPGNVSLHAAITRQEKTREGNPGPVIGSYGIRYDGGQKVYYGGLSFDEEYFQDAENRIRHKGKGISEWNIVENFLFAGTGYGTGDVRSHSEISGVSYSAPSADEMLNSMIDTYFPRFDQHYQNALRKNIK